MIKQKQLQKASLDGEELLEIREFTGKGYLPMVDYGDWRVAILNCAADKSTDKVTYSERHNETDEVFVLLKGQAVLFVGNGAVSPNNLYAQVMELGKIYNVKRGIWHTVVLSPDGSILIVENRDTGKANTDITPLLSEHKHLIEVTVDRVWKTSFGNIST